MIVRAELVRELTNAGPPLVALTFTDDGRVGRTINLTPEELWTTIRVLLHVASGGLIER